ncbi:unnamed protein product [marine sediment metagenome]|uniref:DUF4349 domain-containing protein n=1 Tax=marine sediment metagenome TaxID=412755 RepID=X1SMG4_9ZZZZ
MPAPSPAPQEETGYDEDQSLDRMIVRTGNMALVVEDVAETVVRITELADSYNGYVVSSNSWREGERLMGNIAIRVPVDRFDGAIGALRQINIKVIGSISLIPIHSISKGIQPRVGIG